MDLFVLPLILQLFKKQTDSSGQVSDCSIRRVAQEYRGAPAILIGLTHSTRVLHNEISFIPYTGISLGWGWDSYPCLLH